ncbi:MAG: substrate-binding domain-containing protein [Verrucomicrobia bacterium]|nr:substrate-binding domain-containing protein [Verrucomicrobiota bacterium]
MSARRCLGFLASVLAVPLFGAGTADPALPDYHAEQVVGGGLNSVGDDALAPLMEAWLKAFQAHQPAVTRGERWHHPGGAAAMGALMLEVTDVAPLGRDFWPAELAPYGHQFKGDMMREPFVVRVGTGSFQPAAQAGALAVYVNAANPLSHLSLSQLDAVFGAARRRGAPAAVTTWGQLGLTGDWADRPVVIVAPPDYSTPTLQFQHRVLLDGPWCAAVETEKTPADVLARVTRVPGAIGLAGFLPGTGVRPLALGESASGPFVTASDATVADRTYPLVRPLYLAMNRRPGAPLPAKTREFVSFVLSREGQAILAAYPHFFPLDAKAAAVERAWLDGYLAPLDPRLPAYQTTGPVSGPISNVGSDGMQSLVESWMRAFCRIHPGVHKGDRWSHEGTLNGFQALLAGETDLAPMGRELWPGEKVIYQAVRGQPAPLEIRVARGGFNTPQRTTAQAIFVHAGNPLRGLTVAQVEAVFRRDRPLTRWGQLGLTGAWAERPIRVYLPTRVTPNAMSLQLSVLHGAPWRTDLTEGGAAEIAAAMARDEDAIGFGGFEDGGPGLRAVPLAAEDGGAFVTGTAATVASGEYPLTRYMYIRLNRAPGEKLAPQVREFLRFILSRDGQAFIPTSAYFPLRADEAAVELAKLER